MTTLDRLMVGRPKTSNNMTDIGDGWSIAVAEAPGSADREPARLRPPDYPYRASA
jgi:hypothetical protein